jgi:hypothetical protein
VKVIMLKPLLYISLFLLLFAGLALPVSTAPHGDMNTYLPLVRTGGPNLPSGNLLLYTVGNDDEAFIFVSPPPPNVAPRQVGAGGGTTNPIFSPNGNYILYDNGFNEAGWFFRVMSADGDNDLPLFNILPTGGLRKPNWGPDSRTLAYRTTTTSYGTDKIYSITIDTSTPLTLATNVTAGPAWDITGVGLYYGAVSANGTTDELRRVNADGTNNQLVTAMNGRIFVYGVVADGRILFRLYNNGGDDLYLIRPDGSTMTRITNSPGFETGVAVATGGTKILYEREGGIYLIDLAGTVQWSLTQCGSATCTLAQLPVSWSDDGTEVAFTVQRRIGSVVYYDLYLASTDSSAPPTLLLLNDARRHAFSPDGRYFAYEQEPLGGKRIIQVLDRTTQTTGAVSSNSYSLYFFGWRPLP